MKRPRQLTNANEQSWFWLLNTTSSIFNQASTAEAKIISLALFKKLPAVILQKISTYLPLRRNREQQATLANRALMFTLCYDTEVDTALNTFLHEDYWLDKFLYFIAIEGEDNQNQAEAILKQLLAQENYALMHKLLSSQKPITDAPGNGFKSISAPGYACWAGDTRMSRMLEKYINILEEKGYETKKIVSDECQHIEEQGIAFTFNGETIENSKHFDWQPLITAYRVYIAAATPLINAPNWRDEAWAPAYILWLNIGKELAKVPTHVAQEYCANIPFLPLENYRETLNNLDSKRTVKFYNWLSNQLESWFIRGRVNINLGTLFSIYKGRALLASGYNSDAANCAAGDLAAIIDLCEMRTVNDREQTLENLKPLAPKPNLDFHC